MEGRGGGKGAPEPSDPPKATTQTSGLPTSSMPSIFSISLPISCSGVHGRTDDVERAARLSRRRY